MGTTTTHTATTPYHRVANSTTQTTSIAALQQSSGQLWGKAAAMGGNFSVVKAYRKGLPANRNGIEFVTQHAPAKGHGTPLEARWLYCHDVTGSRVPDCCPAVTLNAQGYAVLAITVTKVVP